ncbi:hypothetical protein ROSMUCSMR3_02899 [Roseovarius mucosus]|uniref:Uncharacterized protein n=1 Tax=Roseovarius mucosus TaxID=215743 RepID=A0A1V0RRP1_9RHOB|nr:hypothetical protein ROSMUCSMR3_02899 [Roseovarius mucosus]
MQLGHAGNGVVFFVGMRWQGGGSKSVPMVAVNNLRTGLSRAAIQTVRPK